MTDEKRLRDIYRIRLRDRSEMATKRRSEYIPSISTIVQRIFNNPQDSQKIQEGQLLMAWPKIVGESIAKNALAHRIKDNRLYVEVTDPIWRQELSFQKSFLLARIRREYPRIKIFDIHFTM